MLQLVFESAWRSPDTVPASAPKTRTMPGRHYPGSSLLSVISTGLLGPKGVTLTVIQEQRWKLGSQIISATVRRNSMLLAQGYRPYRTQRPWLRASSQKRLWKLWMGVTLNACRWQSRKNCNLDFEPAWHGLDTVPASAPKTRTLPGRRYPGGSLRLFVSTGFRLLGPDSAFTGLGSDFSEGLPSRASVFWLRSGRNSG